MTDDDLERRMRTALLGLALLSNARVARLDRSPGRYDPQPIPRLGAHDAAHLFWLRIWQRAEIDDERTAAVAGAEDELDRARISRADPTKVETRKQLDARIVEQGEGWPADDVAQWARCPVRWVHDARRGAERCEAYGRPVEDASSLDPDERQARVHQLHDEGVNSRAIARALGVSYNTIRRDLGKIA